MKKSKILGVLLTLGLVSCASLPEPRGSDRISESRVRDAGYALLDQLLEKLENVDKILVIKTADPATARLIRRTATVAKEAKANLEREAVQAPLIHLQVNDLPVIETQARASIENATTQELLFLTGARFSFRLSQTQSEGTRYGAHLAEALLKHEQVPARRAVLQKIARDFRALNGDFQKHLQLLPAIPAA